MTTDSWVEPFLHLQGLRGSEHRISHVTTLWWTSCLRASVQQHWEDWAANMAVCESLQQGLIAQVCHLELESPSATCLLWVQNLRWMRLPFHVALGLSSERLCPLMLAWRPCFGPRANFLAKSGKHTQAFFNYFLIDKHSLCLVMVLVTIVGSLQHKRLYFSYSQNTQTFAKRNLGFCDVDVIMSFIGEVSLPLIVRTKTLAWLVDFVSALMLLILLGRGQVKWKYAQDQVRNSSLLICPLTEIFIL